jgi:hypothetical protein
VGTGGLGEQLGGGHACVEVVDESFRVLFEDAARIRIDDVDELLAVEGQSRGALVSPPLLVPHTAGESAERGGVTPGAHCPLPLETNNRNHSMGATS